MLDALSADSTAGSSDEVQQGFDLRDACVLFLDLARGGGYAQARAVEEPESPLNQDHGFGGDPSPLHPDLVNGPNDSRVPITEHVGWDVLGDLAVGTDVGHAADPTELMDTGKPADDGSVLDHDLATQGCQIGEDDTIANLYVVGDVATGHQMTILPNNGPAPLSGSTVDGDILSNRCACPHLDRGLLSVKFEILTLHANACEGEYFTFLGDPGVPHNHGVRMQNGTSPDPHVGSDDRKRPYLNPLSEFSGRIDGC